MVSELQNMRLSTMEMHREYIRSVPDVCGNVRIGYGKRGTA